MGISPSRALWAQSLIRLLGSPLEFQPPKRQTTGRSKRISPTPLTEAARRRPTPLTEAASAQMSLIRICDDIWTASPLLQTPQNRQIHPFASETKSTPPLFCPRRLVGPQTSFGTRLRNPPPTGAPLGSTSRSYAGKHPAGNQPAALAFGRLSRATWRIAEAWVPPKTDPPGPAQIGRVRETRPSIGLRAEAPPQNSKLRASAKN